MTIANELIIRYKTVHGKEVVIRYTNVTVKEIDRILNKYAGEKRGEKE